VNRALRAATMGVLLLSPVVLSACSAGQVTQTATQERDKTGAQAQVGDITLRQGQLLAPSGGSYESGDDAELQLAIINSGTEDDTLLSVDGKGFSSAEISSSGSSATGSSSSSSASSTSSAAPTSGSAAATTSGSSAPTSGAPTSSAPTSGAPTSGAPTSSAPTTSAATTTSSGPQEIEIPAGQSVYLGEDGQYTVTLTDLSEDLTPGQYLEVTLTFEKAGEVTIPVTVANPTSSVPRSSSFDFHEQEGGSADAARSSESAGQ
jgi:copper(I)-binding protein